MKINKEWFKEKFDNAKEFVLDHKVEFIVGGCVLSAAVISVATRRKRAMKSAINACLKAAEAEAELLAAPLNMAAIDEHIHTVLANQIEHFVTTPGFDAMIIDTTYTLKYPNADKAKKVVCTISDVTDAVTKAV